MTLSHNRQVDPDYFSLCARQPMRADLEPELYPDDPLSEVEDPDEEEVLGEFDTDPEMGKAGVAVADAEAAVLAAEDAGVPDGVAMRRLDQARATEKAVLMRLQKARTVAHTLRAEPRPARVIAMRSQGNAPQDGEAA